MTIYSPSSEFPNQRISVEPEGYYYDIVLKTFRGMTYATITNRNGDVLASNVRCCNNEPIIFAKAKNYNGAGNFAFVDDEGQYPYFEDFGKTCMLVYYTKSELE